MPRKRRARRRYQFPLSISQDDQLSVEGIAWLIEHVEKGERSKTIWLAFHEWRTGKTRSENPEDSDLPSNSMSEEEFDDLMDRL